MFFMSKAYNVKKIIIILHGEIIQTFIQVLGSRMHISFFGLSLNAFLSSVSVGGPGALNELAKNSIIG